MEYSKVKIAIGFAVLVLLSAFCIYKTYEVIYEDPEMTAQVIEDVIISDVSPGLASTKKVEVEMNRFSKIRMNDKERHMLCDVIYDLAGGKSQVEQRRVCEIVFNRVLSDEFPNNVEDVINDLYPCAQFEYVSGLGGDFQQKIIDVVLFDEPLTRFDYYYY